MRALDLALRFAFFAAVPFLGAFVSALFPMTPVLVNVALTLIVFAAAEAVRERAARSPLFHKVMKRRLDFEAHYREHPPRPFLFYVFYPLLLPYVLARMETRRELWLFRGLTGGGMVVLVGGAVADYFLHWQPHLGSADFARSWVVLFVIQTLCIFLFLMPVATTVVKMQMERRFLTLWALLVVGAISASMAIGLMVKRRGHVVSWVTTERVKLRTKASPAAAKTAQVRALRAAFDHATELADSTDPQGWVEGDALDRAEEYLETFYKADEAYAFSLHAAPAISPKVLILQCHLGRGAEPIWRAIKSDGTEIASPADLPKGVLGLARRTTRRPPDKRAPGKPKTK